MKHLFFFIILLYGSSLFSQTEVWGVKSYGGELGGGLLFKIDSATSQIDIQHRFEGDFLGKSSSNSVNSESYPEGSLPRMIIQMDNGNVVGFTKYGGNADGASLGSGVLFNFVSETGEYEVEFASDDVLQGHSFFKIYKMRGNNISIFLKKQYGWDYTNYAHYLYNMDNQELVFLDSIQKNWHETFPIIQESDTSLLYHYGPYEGTRLYRYLPFSQSLIDICSFESASNVCLYRFNELIYSAYNDGELYLKTFNYLTNEYQMICNLSNYLSEADRVDPVFDFKVADDGNLIGEFNEAYFWEDANWMIYYKRAVKLDLETLEMNEVFEYVDDFRYGRYSYIDDYSKTGAVFALSSWDSEDNGLYSLDYINADKILLYSFDLSQNSGSYTSDVIHSYLAKFKKVENNTGLTLLDLSGVDIYHSNESLVVRSVDIISNAKIVIYNISGQMVFETVESDFYSITKAVKLKDGIYIVLLQSENGVVTKKIISND